MPGVLSDQEGAGNIDYQLAHIHETRANTLIAACASLSVLASIAIFLRILVRWRTRAAFKADDYTIFVTLVCFETHAGFGRILTDIKSRFLHGLPLFLCFMVWLPSTSEPSTGTHHIRMPKRSGIPFGSRQAVAAQRLNQSKCGL